MRLEWEAPCEWGGKSAPFGVDEEQIEPILLRIAGDPYLDFCGIHLFLATKFSTTKFCSPNIERDWKSGNAPLLS